VHVLTLVPQAPIKRFNEGNFHKFPWANEVELHPSTIGPIFQRPRWEFGPMIHRDRAWPRFMPQHSVEDLPTVSPTFEILPLGPD
jgi:hypothetical protein